MNYGQTLPNLGVASDFVLFSGAGAFSVNGNSTNVTGDVGTNVGAFTGFPPGVLNGDIHVANTTTALAMPIVNTAYAYLAGLPCGLVLSTPFGGGQTLTPNTYCVGSAADLSGDLILDGQCDPNAVFIFQINGALSTTVLSNVILINGASICNVYWQVNGAFELGEGSVFRGNLIGNGAISLLEGSSLFGRALTRSGAIALHNNFVDINSQEPSPSVITASGPTTFCAGGSVTLSGNCGGVFSNGATTSSITVTTSGSYSVTNSNSCGSATSNTIIVTVNPLPICTITGATSICAGQSTQLCAPAGAASYLWSNGGTSNCITVSAAGNYTVTVTSAAGCTNVCSATVIVNAAPVCTITGTTSICAGQSTQLCAPAGATSYLWSNGGTGNCITVSTAGTYTVTVTNAAGCSSVCSQAVTVNPLPVCTITGATSICFGQSTQLCVPAGAASYLWSTGGTGNCISVSAAGTYAVTVTSAAGCSSVCSISVDVNPLPICTITGNPSVCAGQSTQLCVPAGAASYLWSTGATTNCINVSTAGTYTVTVTNADGCSSICSQAVVVTPLPICTITGDLSICQGQSTQLCVPPGAASYLWNTGATTNCITVSTAGIYTVIVTDINGCSSVCSTSVSVNPLPVCTITGDDFVCAAGQLTQICVPPGAASYLWSTAETTNCITVSAGNYAVTVTDENGCSSVCTKIITINPTPVCTITGDDFICAEGQSTELCVAPGATAYLWNTGATTNCITINTAGTYSVTVTNAGGCTSICSKTVIVTPLTTCTITGNNFLCEGQSTQICVPAGAIAYLWSTGATTNCISVSAAGTYSVTITNANGCNSICSLSVSMVPLPVCTITGNDFICRPGQTTQLCVPAGAASYLWSTGAITNCISVNAAGLYSVTVTNASGCSSVCSREVIINPPPDCIITGDDFLCEEGQSTELCVSAGAASYLWSTGASTNCITVNAAGTYAVTVTDENGCSSICSKTVIVNPLPLCKITGDGFICEGQSTQLCVPAGAMSYLWSTGETTNCILVNAAGLYSVTVTSLNGCISICSQIVTLNPTPVCMITGNDIICEGQTTQLCVPAGAISYLWSTGATTNCITVNAAGTYAVTVTNENGCTSICSKTVLVNPLPVCTIMGDNILCLGESTQLCVPAGATSYLWSTGATTNCITVNTAGTYVVTVTYSNGCSSICSKTVVVSPLPICTISGANFICEAGQTTQLCVPAGAASYLWSTGATTNCITVSTAGTYVVTVTSASGCSSVCSQIVTLNPAPVCVITGDDFICEEGQLTQLCVPAGAASYLWSTGATTNCIIASATGTYSVTVTASNGCTSVCSKTISLNEQPTCTITGNGFICIPGQTTQLCVPAGASSYLWSNGATTNCILVSTPGTYSVTVTSSNGCTSVCSKTVVVDALPDCLITGGQILCEGESTQLCVPPGASSYLWSNGAITNCITVGAPGNYSVTVTYANGCTSVCSKTVIVDTLQPCIITGDHIICEGESTQLCVPPGASSYLWSNGAITNCITVSSPGTYSVTVTYANGCTSICSATVTVSPAPVCAILGDCVIPCGGQPILLYAPAGCTSYWWSTGATTPYIVVTTPGVYSLTVTNAAGCSSVCTRTVVVGPAPPCQITGNCVLTCGGAPVVLCAPAGTGCVPVDCTTYWWSTGATTQCISVHTPGMYAVTVTYGNGCSSVCWVNVTQGYAPPVCVITGCTSMCGGQPTPLCAPPGCASYWWSTGEMTQCILACAPGNYTVTVTYANGCSSTACVTVTQPPPPTCVITGNCVINTGQSTLLCAPAGCINYLWNTGATTSCILVSTPGVYSVTVTNTNGCTSACWVTVTGGHQTPVCEIDGNYNICEGQTTMLCAPVGYTAYLWSTGATTSCILVNTAGEYAVTATAANGTTATGTRTVVLTPTPVCVISGNASICQGEPMLLCATPGATSYLWSTGATTSCIMVTAAGVYAVTTTNGNGCSSTCSKTVSAGIAPTCTISTILVPGSDTTTTLCVPFAMASYLWSNGDTSRCITVDTSGTFSVTVTDENGCSSTCETDVTNLISDTSQWEGGPIRDGYLEAKIFPNPFTELSTVEFINRESSSHVVIELYRLSGSKITTLFEQDIEKGKIYRTDVNAEGLADGVYICRIVNGAQIINKKLVLIK